MHARTSNVTRPRLSADDPPRLASARPSQSVAAAASDVARPARQAETAGLRRHDATTLATRVRTTRWRGPGRGEELLASDPAATWCQTRQRRPTHPPCDESREREKERRVVLPSRTADGRPLTPLRSAPRPPTCTIHPSPAADRWRAPRRHARSVRRLTGPVVVVGPTRDFDGVLMGAARTPAAAAAAGRRCPQSPHPLSFFLQAMVPLTAFLFSTAGAQAQAAGGSARIIPRPDPLRDPPTMPLRGRLGPASFVPARRAVLSSGAGPLVGHLERRTGCRDFFRRKCVGRAD